MWSVAPLIYTLYFLFFLLCNRFVQIGAPGQSRNDVTNYRSGVVYRCNLHGPCKIYSVEKDVGVKGGKGVRTFKAKDDEAWIGVSIDLKEMGTNERSVVSLPVPHFYLSYLLLQSKILIFF